MKCEKCDKGELVERQGKNGAFLGCTNYPECKNTKKLQQQETTPPDSSVDRRQLLIIRQSCLKAAATYTATMNHGSVEAVTSMAEDFVKWVMR